MSVGKLAEAAREQLRSRAPQLETLGRAVGFVARSAPNELRNLVLLNLVFGTGPPLLLWLGKVVIDALADTAGQAETWQGALRALLSQPNLYLAVSGFVLLHLLLDSAETIGDLQTSMMRDRVEGAAKEQLYRKVSGARSMAIFEAPKAQDVLHLAERAVGRLQDVSRVVGNLLIGFFVLIPTLVLSASLAWWVPLVIFLTAAPSIHVQLHYEARQWRTVESQASTLRRMEAYASILTRAEYAKELRVFGLRSYFLDRWRRSHSATLEEMRRVDERGPLSFSPGRCSVALVPVSRSSTSC